MPYEKVLVTHKFGIISQSHKKELLERLKDRREKLEKDSARRSAKTNDDIINLQINEDFVKSYNEATVEKKTKLNHQCVQIYEKIKKKLINWNTIDDLSIQIYWAELSQLMQCNSPIQEECMDLFILSLEYAKLSSMQIPTLFFLAETVLYWIRTDTINQPYLRAFEIKLLKVGELIFQRIYFHMLEKSIENERDLKEHLSVYLNGFDELITAYASYPDAYLYLKYITSVGNYLMSGIKQQSDKDTEILTTSQFDWTESSATKTNTNTTSNTLKAANRESRKFSLLLKCSINLFVHLNKKSDPELTALLANDVILVGLDLNSDDWIDSALAVYILGECAKINIKALDALLYLSRGVDVTSSLDSSTNNFAHLAGKYGLETWPCELACIYVDVLADVCINSNNSLIKRKALLGFNKDAHEILKQNPVVTRASAGYGLLEMCKFQSVREAKKNNNQDDDSNTSWKLRYMSIKGLVRICKCLVDKENEEFRKTCWCSLIVLQESEKNTHVLEAIKVGQVNSKIDKPQLPKKTETKNVSQSSASSVKSLNMYCHIALRLVHIVNENIDKDGRLQQAAEQSDVRLKKDLTMGKNFDINLDQSLKFEDIPYGRMAADNINDASHATTANQTSRTKTDSAAYTAPKNHWTHKKRTTLRDEIILSNLFEMKIPPYFERKNFDLMRIVDDQYRKEVNRNIDKEFEEEANFSN